MTISQAHAQKFELVETIKNPSKQLKQSIIKELNKEKEFSEFKAKMGGGIPYIEISTVDLNFDEKKEIVVRLLHEYSFRDRRNNIQTYIYAQTSRGLIKIFDAMAGDIALKNKGIHGLKNIAAFKGLTSAYDLYVWNGKEKYIKQ